MAKPGHRGVGIRQVSVDILLFLIDMYFFYLFFWKSFFVYNFFFIYVRRNNGINRQLSAGSGFSCAVTWAGEVVSWGNNAQCQCGVPAAELGFIKHPERVPLPASAFSQSFAVQVSCVCVRARDRIYSPASESTEGFAWCRIPKP
jgi:hypothetical protein